MIYINTNPGTFHAWTAEDDALLDERRRLLYDTVNTVIERHVYRLPVDIGSICKAYRVRVIPMSWYVEQGMSADDLRKVWHNPDGAASRGPHGEAVINYDDGAPLNRARFTLSEELMHVLLGHTKDPHFSMFDRLFDAGVYGQYEREAKTAAGLLLIPASVFLRYPGSGMGAVSHLCGVSEACAWTTFAWYREHEDEIRKYATRKAIAYDPRELVRSSGTRDGVDVWPGAEL